MSQHDFNVSGDQFFPDYVSDLNNAIGALVTHSSGNDEPTTTYPAQIWVDTTVNPALVKMRNLANNAWVTLGTVSNYLGITPSQIGTLTTAEINAAIAAALVPYLTSANAASTYLTIANAASTYQPLTEAWNNVTTFNGGWSNFETTETQFNRAKYRKEGTNIRLKGVLKCSNVTPNNVIFTLPSGFQPNKREICQAIGSTNANPGIARVDIETNGDVIFDSFYADGASGTEITFLSIDNICLSSS